MQLKVRVKFKEPWSSIIPEVAKQCNLTIEEYCRRAVQVLTKQGIEEGERRGKSGSNESQGDGIEMGAGPSVDSHALANEKNTELQPAVE